MVPATASKVFVAVEVSMGENIQAGTFLVADDDG
jgi:hypothetical protein